MSARPGAPRRNELTKAEMEVLRLMCDGLSNAEIAAKRWVTVETTRNQVKAIRRKLGARSRAHAVSIAFRSGIL